jgi:hypothetical protein
MWKEAALSCLKVIRKVSRRNRDSNLTSLEYKSDVCPPEQASLTDWLTVALIM